MNFAVVAIFNEYFLVASLIISIFPIEDDTNSIRISFELSVSPPVDVICSLVVEGFCVVNGTNGGISGGGDDGGDDEISMETRAGEDSVGNSVSNVTGTVCLGSIVAFVLVT